MAGVIQIRCPKCHRRNAIKNKKCSGCKINIQRLEIKDWWIDFPDGNGKRVHERIGPHSTKVPAQNRLNEVQNQITEGRYIRKNKNSEWNLGGILKWYLGLDEIRHQRSFRDKEMQLEKAINKIGKNRKISDLNLDNIEAYKQARREETVGNPPRKIKPATINRDLAYLRSMLNLGVKHGKLEKNPFTGLTMLAENNIRERVLSPEEFERLVNFCPDHLKPVVITAYYLPMRKSEILRMTWDEMNFKEGFLEIRGVDANNKKHRRSIPLHPRVMEALQLLKSRFHPSKRVFLDHNGKPFNDCKKGFNGAVRKAELGDFHFHDLRHCAINNLRLAGNDYLKIMAISGHRTMSVFQRYTMVSREEVKAMKWLDEESLNDFDVHDLG